MSITSESTGGLGDFRAGAGFLLSRLGSMAQQSWNETLRAAGLTQSEFVVLVTLTYGPSRRQRELAQQTGIDSRNLTPVLGALKARGWVLARPDPDDGRATLLTSTREGRSTLADLEAGLVPERERFFGALAAEEYAELCRLLEVVYRSHVTG